jgi:hypothetical protein
MRIKFPAKVRRLAGRPSDLGTLCAYERGPRLPGVVQSTLDQR